MKSLQKTDNCPFFADSTTLLTVWCVTPDRLSEDVSLKRSGLWREGWSQEDIGNALGVGQQTVGRWVSGATAGVNIHMDIEPPCANSCLPAVNFRTEFEPLCTNGAEGEAVGRWAGKWGQSLNAQTRIEPPKRRYPRGSGHRAARTVLVRPSGRLAHVLGHVGTNTHAPLETCVLCRPRRMWCMALRLCVTYLTRMTLGCIL